MLLFIYFVFLCAQCWIEVELKPEMSLQMLSMTVEKHPCRMPAVARIATGMNSILMEEVNQVDLRVELESAKPNFLHEVVLLLPYHKVWEEEGTERGLNEDSVPFIDKSRFAPHAKREDRHTSSLTSMYPHGVPNILTQCASRGKHAQPRDWLLFRNCMLHQSLFAAVSFCVNSDFLNMYLS